jgi:Zn-finger domain-containing protein
LALESIQGFLSLPALMKLLGHKDIRTTLRDALVTQQDLQCEFHRPDKMPFIPITCPRSPCPKASRTLTFPASVRRWR